MPYRHYRCTALEADRIAEASGNEANPLWVVGFLRGVVSGFQQQALGDDSANSPRLQGSGCDGGHNLRQIDCV